MDTQVKVERKEDGADEDTLPTTGDTGCMTQEELPGSIKIIDSKNGFNKLSRLEMLWTLRHLWLEGCGLPLIYMSIGDN